VPTPVQRTLAPVIPDFTRLAVVILGDRLVTAVLRRRQIETFLVDAENLAVALRAELDQRKVNVRSIAIGLPRAAATVKPIDLPTGEGDVRDMMRFELERHLPSGGEEASFDYLPLPQPETADAVAGRPVLIAAAEKRVIEGALRLAEEARLRPVSLTVAAHNLPALVVRRRGQRIVWLHRVGDQTVEVLFLAAGQLVFSRSLSANDDAVLVQDIERSFGIIRWRGCDAVWVSGDFDPVVSGFLAALGAPVTEPAYTPLARQWLAGIDAPRGASELAVAVAARRNRPLELLPEPLRPRRLSRAQLITAGALAATLLLVVTALLVPGFRQTRRLASINARIASMDSEVRGVEATLRELERKRRLFTTVQTIQAASVRPLPVLRELTELLPTDAWLTMLSLDTKGVELTGQAGAAAALIPLLENSPRLERVEFSSPVTRGRDREQFRIRAAWEVTPGTALAAPAAVSAAPVRPTPPPAPGAPPAAAVEPDSSGVPVQPRRPSGPIFPGGQGR
jgi:Tfp pilus assembly protein PilN